MIHLVNLPYDIRTLRPQFATRDAVERFLTACGCDAFEIIYGGRGAPSLVPRSRIGGYHLMFYAAWMDFWREDVPRLNAAFGAPEVWQGFYHGTGRADLVRQFERDLDRAQRFRVPYVVFHVSEVTPEECYTLRSHYSDEEIVDAAAELINLLLDGKRYTFDFLMENLPWAGSRFTRPEVTERLLAQVHYPKKGLLLDTGHLMCTNPDLENEHQALDYVHQCLDRHGALCRYIRGVHLHRSLSGRYVKERGGRLPELPEDYYERFRISYEHVLRVDQHQPVTAPEVRDLMERIAPQYLTHEIAAQGWEEKSRLVRDQRMLFAP